MADIALTEPGLPIPVCVDLLCKAARCSPPCLTKSHRLRPVSCPSVSAPPAPSSPRARACGGSALESSSHTVQLPKPSVLRRRGRPCRPQSIILDRRDCLFQPQNVSSTIPRTRLQTSIRRLSKSSRNRRAQRLAAGAGFRVAARPVAARQPDRRFAVGTVTEPARGRIWRRR